MTSSSNRNEDLKEGAEIQETGEIKDRLDTAPLDSEAGDDTPRVEGQAAQSPEPTVPRTTMGQAATSKRAKSKGLSVKAIAAIALVVAIAGVLVAVQLFSAPKAVKLSAHEMELIVGELMPPMQQQELAESQEKRKEFANRLKQLLAVAEQAKVEGYDKRAEVQTQLAGQEDALVYSAYKKKHPEATVSEEEINAFYQANPNEFDTFIQNNPRQQAQAQGPQRESMKKQFGEFKVMLGRAKKEGLDQDEVVKIQAILERSQTLVRAYLGDLQKSSDKLVSDADIEQYYEAHKDEFEQVHVRHILISTSPEEHSEDDGHGHSKEEAAKKTKPLTKEEARQKAQSILDRIRKGEDFAKLAKEHSDDGSAAQGGDLAQGDDKYLTRGMTVPQFEQVAFSLKPGDVSDVVETEFGFHIIKVEEHRTAPITDTKTREQIAEKLKQTKLVDRIEEIAAASKIEVAEDFTINPKPLPQPQMMPSGSGGGAPPTRQ